MNTAVGLVLGVVGLMISGVVLAWRLPEWMCLVVAVTVVLAAAAVMYYLRRRDKPTAQPAPEESLLYTIRAPPTWQDPVVTDGQGGATATSQADGAEGDAVAADEAPAPGEDRLWRRRPRT